MGSEMCIRDRALDLSRDSAALEARRKMRQVKMASEWEHVLLKLRQEQQEASVAAERASKQAAEVQAAVVEADAAVVREGVSADEAGTVLADLHGVRTEMRADADKATGMGEVSRRHVLQATAAAEAAWVKVSQMQARLAEVYDTPAATGLMESGASTMPAAYDAEPTKCRRHEDGSFSCTHGLLSPAEVDCAEAEFYRYDIDGDGFVSWKDFQCHGSSLPIVGAT